MPEMNINVKPLTFKYRHLTLVAHESNAICFVIYEHNTVDSDAIIEEFYDRFSIDAIFGYAIKDRTDIEEVEIVDQFYADNDPEDYDIKSVRRVTSYLELLMKVTPVDDNFSSVITNTMTNVTILDFVGERALNYITMDIKKHTVD